MGKSVDLTEFIDREMARGPITTGAFLSLFVLSPVFMLIAMNNGASWQRGLAWAVWMGALMALVHVMCDRLGWTITARSFTAGETREQRYLLLRCVRTGQGVNDPALAESLIRLAGIQERGRRWVFLFPVWLPTAAWVLATILAALTADYRSAVQYAAITLFVAGVTIRAFAPYVNEQTMQPRRRNLRERCSTKDALAVTSRDCSPPRHPGAGQEPGAQVPRSFRFLDPVSSLNSSGQRNTVAS